MTRKEINMHVIRAMHASNSRLERTIRKILSTLKDSDIEEATKKTIETTEPFSVDRWNRETIVRNNSGLAVEILGLDLCGDYPVYGTVKGKLGKHLETWTINGKCQRNRITTDHDLVLVIPKKTTTAYIHILDGRLEVTMDEDAKDIIATVELPL